MSRDKSTLSHFLSGALSPFSTSHVLSPFLVLSLILSPFIFLSPLRPSFFSLITFFYLITDLFILFSVWAIVSFSFFLHPLSYLLFSLFFILILLLLLHVKYPLSILSSLISFPPSFSFNSFSFSFPVCFLDSRSVLGLFTYSLSLLPQSYTNPLLSLRTA